MSSTTRMSSMSNEELLASLEDIVARSNEAEADLVEHIAEVDARKLYLDRAYPSLFAFCTRELGFAEGAAYNRIEVARASRQFPVILDVLRSGKVHLSGLRILAPHLSAENHEALLTESSGKSKREIEEIVARWFPKPPVPDRVRKLPQPVAHGQRLPDPGLLVAHVGQPSGEGAAAARATGPTPTPAGPGAPTVEVGSQHPDSSRSQQLAAGIPSTAVPAAAGPGPSPLRGTVEPLSEEHFRVQLTCDRALKDKLREAQDLLRHSVPDGSLSVIIDRAVSLLIEKAKKERFGVGRKARPCPARPSKPGSRHIPNAIKRAVYERDGGQCSFVDDEGRRCSEHGGLELDHAAGFAREPVHSVAGIRLRCRAHNAHAAEQLYGREFMDGKRAAARNERSSARKVPAELHGLGPMDKELRPNESHRGFACRARPITCPGASWSATP